MPAPAAVAPRVESAQPEVHITIGTVEVRSREPAPRPAPARPRTPSLSLSDYLSQRTGRS